MFTVDGVLWSLPCDIERVSDLKETDISGWMMDGQYFIDPQGQYLTYSVSLVVPRSSSSLYSSLYENLTDPDNPYHNFWFPYNQTQVNVIGKVDRITDTYVRDGESGILWRHTKFTVAATAPRRMPT